MCDIYIWVFVCVCSRTDEERFGKIIYACMEIIIKGIHDGIDQKACMRKREGRVCRSILTEWALLPVLTVRKENINKNNSIPTSFFALYIHLCCSAVQFSNLYSGLTEHRSLKILVPSCVKYDD